MNCPLETRENAQLLLDYCTRRLEAEPAAALERHIAMCGACREFAQGQRAVWEALDDWEAAPVSADFDRRLYRRIEVRVSWWELLVRRFRPRPQWRRLPAAAMVCMLLIAGVMLDRSAVSPAPSPGDTAQVESVQPEQVERTLDAMEVLDEFSHHVRADGADSKL